MIGRHHPTVRKIRTLHRDGQRRREEGVFLAEGLNLAREALATDATVRTAVVSPRLMALEGGPELRRRLERRGVEILETADSVLEGLQDPRSPQPILLVVASRCRSLTEVLDSGNGTPLVVVVHALQDPGNLGSVLRTADAAGASAFLASGDGTDLHHPRVVRASMGSIFRLPAAVAAPEEVLEELARRGVRTFGSSPSAGVDYDRADFSGPSALFVGRESGGLPDESLARMDHTVRIPMREGLDSLSVGAAAAVLLFEAARQRR